LINHSVDPNGICGRKCDPRNRQEGRRNDDRASFAFAGIWTEFKGNRGTKSKPIPGLHVVYPPLRL
jgi:hypothetical protein